MSEARAPRDAYPVSAHNNQTEERPHELHYS